MLIGGKTKKENSSQKAKTLPAHFFKRPPRLSLSLSCHKKFSGCGFSKVLFHNLIMIFLPSFPFKKYFDQIPVKKSPVVLTFTDGGWEDAQTPVKRWGAHNQKWRRTRRKRVLRVMIGGKKFFSFVFPPMSGFRTVLIGGEEVNEKKQRKEKKEKAIIYLCAIGTGR